MNAHEKTRPAASRERKAAKCFGKCASVTQAANGTIARRKCRRSGARLRCPPQRTGLDPNRIDWRNFALAVLRGECRILLKCEQSPRKNRNFRIKKPTAGTEIPNSLNPGIFTPERLANLLVLLGPGCAATGPPRLCGEFTVLGIGALVGFHRHTAYASCTCGKCPILRKRPVFRRN